MKALLRQHYIVLASMVVTIILVGIGFFFLLNLMKEREARVHEVKQTLATYEQNKKIFAEENKKIQNLNTRITALEAKRITEASVPNLLSSFEVMAQERSVSVTITSVQTPLIDGKKRLYIDLASTGTFQGINAFIEEILSQPYQIRFAKLSLYQDEAPSTGPGVPTVQWQMLASLEVISF